MQKVGISKLGVRPNKYRKQKAGKEKEASHSLNEAAGRGTLLWHSILIEYHFSASTARIFEIEADGRSTTFERNK